MKFGELRLRSIQTRARMESHSRETFNTEPSRSRSPLVSFTASGPCTQRNPNYTRKTYRFTITLHEREQDQKTTQPERDVPTGVSLWRCTTPTKHQHHHHHHLPQRASLRSATCVSLCAHSLPICLCLSACLSQKQHYFNSNFGNFMPL